MTGMFTSEPIRVAPAWTDANQHLNSVQYLELFRKAAGAFLGELGVSQSSASTFFQAEAHIRYERELLLDEPLVIHSWLIAVSDKRLHHFHEMRHASAGFRAATVEYLHLHIDRASRRAAPMPVELFARLRSALLGSAAQPDARDIGRAIGLQATSRHAPDVADEATVRTEA